MRRILLLAIVLIAISIPGGVSAQPAISSELAPLGKLRVAMNAETPVLLQRTPDGKITGGVALEVGKFIAEKLGVPFELVPYAGAVAYQQSFGKGDWDIGFGGKSSASVREAHFILDVLLTDYLFLAAPGRQFADAAQVDRPGVKIGVGTDTSSDRFLSRTVKSAELVRPGVSSIEALRTGQVDVWAGSASSIEQAAKGLPGAKIVPGAFTSDQTMVILPKGRSSAAQAKLAEIVNEAKKTGVVRKALEQTGVKGVRASP